MSVSKPISGEKAPDFTLLCDDGREITLSALAGSRVVLFFYPRDDTPGCTKEACGFSEEQAKFAQTGTLIFGISRDTLTKHAKFREKYGLTVGLLSDDDGKVCEDYGVWVEKNMYGRTYMGIERSTFLIDENGEVAQAWRKVKVPGHVGTVLKTVQSLWAGETE